MDAKKSIIEFNNVTKIFGKFIANKNISFTINEGDRIGIIGANGAGKSTLVSQLIGILKPTSGEIKYLFDYDVSPQEKMGMQFQESSYPSGLTVKDIIDFSLKIYASEIDEKTLDELLTKFQMRDFYKSKAKGLSGGQQQKLNVLLAIIHKPKIVILDEISTGLDISAREEIMSYVFEFTTKHRMTTILISHHMTEIELLCNRLITLDKGEIFLDAMIEDVKKQYGSVNTFISDVIKGNIKISEEIKHGGDNDKEI